MLNVFVCEDNAEYLEKISAFVKDYIMMNTLDMEVTLAASDPSEILAIIKNHTVKGLYFLDIELAGGYNGIELAKEIRNYDPRAYIVFITSHTKYLPLTFEYHVEALGYIQKKDGPGDILEPIKKCIDNVYQKHISRSDEGNHVFKAIGGKSFSLNYSEVLFLESDTKNSHRSVLYAKKRAYLVQGNLKNIFEELPRGMFFRCHKSAIVNMNSLTERCKTDLEQDKNFITMSNGAECPVSSRKKRELLNLLK